MLEYWSLHRLHKFVLSTFRAPATFTDIPSHECMCEARGMNTSLWRLTMDYQLLLPRVFQFPLKGSSSVFRNSSHCGVDLGTHSLLVRYRTALISALSPWIHLSAGDSRLLCEPYEVHATSGKLCFCSKSDVGRPVLQLGPLLWLFYHPFTVA